jgi:Ca-activated chloride channel family protein
VQFTAQLDVDVVALEAEDEVTCLVSLTAPVPEEIADRPGETLIAVVGRSGSMSGGPIDLHAFAMLNDAHTEAAHRLRSQASRHLKAVT